MNKTILAVLAAVAVIATGCVKTVSDTNAFATTWSKDSISGRYQRSLDQVYQASVAVINNDGVLIQEYIPHDSTNAVRSLLGRVNGRKVWVRVEAVDPRITQLTVQTRSNWGVSDVALSSQLVTEIALKLAQ